MTAKGYLRAAGATELTTVVGWCMGVTLSKFMNQWWQNW